jgi:hypothetical protein
MAGSTALAATAAIGLPAARAVPRFTRKSLEGGNVAKDLASYKKAVKAMLALPPSDPRNWYRNAFTHLMDCPHSNWWFLVWHRGYLAHLEAICREMSGDPDFALPFWDWTKEPKIPASFWDDVLDPNHSDYVPDLATFRRDYKPVLQTYWNNMTGAQRTQQAIRGRNLGYANFEQFWTVAEGMFVPRGRTRRLTQANPDLPPRTRAAVAANVTTDLLAPDEFVTPTGDPAFESVHASSHHDMPGDYSILEGQPHNLVHDGIGGLMGLFLSPSDPIFFMHHCNIDRLWSVWTDKQLANGNTTHPPANLWEAYKSEPFLFYHEADGSPATQTQAGDYFSIQPFQYDYEPGSGDDTAPALVAGAAIPSVTSENLAKTLSDQATADAQVALSGALRDRIRTDARGRFFATVEITPPDQVIGVAFNVFVGAAGAELDTTPGSDNFAGSFSFFGPRHAGGPARFKVGITETLQRLRERRALEKGDGLQVVVTTDRRETAMPMAKMQTGADRPGLLNAVQIGAF